MARFFPLTVKHISHITRDSAVLTLQPRPEDHARFRFIQGQYLTFRRKFGEIEVRRSYSICAGVDDTALRVGIKRVEGGCFSNWANDNLSVGDELEAMPPMGNFHTPLEPELAKHYLGFAGGSGITPVLGIIKTVLGREPKANFTLVYANRTVSSIMFREELEDLKNLHLGRLQIVHILEHEAQDNPLFTGRIDSEKCQRLFRSLIDVTRTTVAFICGPEPMMLTIAKELEAAGLSEDRIKFELFLSAQPGRLQKQAHLDRAQGDAPPCRLAVTLDGTTREIAMEKGQSVLEAALGAELDAPFACTAGVCSTCRAMLIDGEVDMLANHALEDYEVRRGYILTCQSRPLTERLAVSYDL